MARVNRNLCFVALMILINLFLLLVVFVFIGNPIHDFNLWRLTLQYKKMTAFHPVDTSLVSQKRYLGGPWSHGSSHCIYAIGEIRRARLTKQEIREAYKNVPVFSTENRQAKFEIYFPDDRYVSMDSPIGDWFDEIRQDKPVLTDAEMKYLLYVAQEDAFYWGDQRCWGS